LTLIEELNIRLKRANAVSTDISFFDPQKEGLKVMPLSGRTLRNKPDIFIQSLELEFHCLPSNLTVQSINSNLLTMRSGSAGVGSDAYLLFLSSPYWRNEQAGGYFIVEEIKAIFENEYQQTQKDICLLQELVSILQNHCGERGNNEGAAETLERIIRERDNWEKHHHCVSAFTDPTVTAPIFNELGTYYFVINERQAMTTDRIEGNKRRITISPKTRS
jgi:hypothetical protein